MIRFVFPLLSLLLVITGCWGDRASVTPTPAPTKLVILTHWGEPAVREKLDARLAEYMRLNPTITIEHQSVPFSELLPKITTTTVGDIRPDIYHIYNLWLPEFVSGGVLAPAPAEATADIEANYSPGSIAAVRVDDQLWGYPTEINTYQLIYNKKLLAEAGFDRPPETWAELREIACATTRRDETGQITQSGLIVTPGWDSGVVHPFLALLWSNGGSYLDVASGRATFDSPAAVETLQLYRDLIERKCLDLEMRLEDFINGRAGMIVMANWWRANLQSAFTDGYENVGVGPIPHGPGGNATTLQYNWLLAVNGQSPQADAAWKLAQWLNSPAGVGEPSPIGTFLIEANGAIPSRLSDQEALAAQYDDFLRGFIEMAQSAQPEPVVAGGQEIKSALQSEIEAVWFGQKAPADALAAAAAEANRILQERR